MSFRNSTDDGKVKLLIDFSNAVWRSYYATEQDNLLNSEGTNVGFILGTVKLFNYAYGNCMANHWGIPELIVCEDRAPIRKFKLYSKYQSAFKNLEPDKTWDKISSDKVRYKGNREKIDLNYKPTQIMEEFLSCLPHTRIYAEQEEADDVIATYVNSNKEKTYIFSTDKDLWQLMVQPHIGIILDDGKEITLENLQKKFLTTDWQKIPLFKTIKGDSSDNVRGVPRFQFKRNLEVYDKCDGSIKDYLLKIKSYSYKDYCKLLEYKELLKLNLNVVTLKTNIEYVTKKFTETNKEKWIELCNKYEVPSLIDDRILNNFL